MFSILIKYINNIATMATTGCTPFCYLAILSVLHQRNVAFLTCKKHIYLGRIL